MMDWSKISDICKYVVDGENAKRVYDVLRESYVGKHKMLPHSWGEHGYKIEYRYEDGVLYIEEHSTGGIGSEIEFLLDFLIPYDSYYLLRERSNDGAPMLYDVRDEEGKYFVRPPKTEYELQMEAEFDNRLEFSNEMPF